MRAIRASRSTAVAIGLVALAAAGLAVAVDRPGTAAPPCPQTSPVSTPVQAASTPGQPVAETRQADRAAIQKTLDELCAAFKKGDGKMVAGLWTPGGEYTSDDGAAFTGRAALEKAYGEFFSKNPDNALEVEVDGIRFPSRDTAVVEGHFKLHKGKKKELVVSRCSFLYTREDGKWLIAIAREWPGDGLSVRDLEWLIGTWEAKRKGMVATTKYEWSPNKTFIRCQFTINQDGRTHTGAQVFGKDPATGLIRVWTFEDSGGIGEADVIRDGNKWRFAAHGTTADGDSITATNLMTPVDGDSFLWQSVERKLNDESQPDLPPIKVIRVKGK